VSGIAIVIESFGGGGAQHVASALANHWAANGITVTAITFATPDSDVFRLDPRVRRVVTGGSGVSRNPLAGVLANAARIRSVRTAIRGSGAPIVLSFVGSTNVLTVLACVGLGKRVIISERNDPARQSLGRSWDLLRRLVYPRADRVIANSQAAIATMKGYVPAEKLLWLPNPLRRAAETTRPLETRESFFLAAGRLDAQKAYDVLLAAFAQVARGRNDLALVILGNGPLRETLETQARELQIAERVRFMGRVDDPFPFYRAALALVHPARFEGMPNAVLEAMSEGLPPIISDAQEGLRDIVRDGQSGLVVPVESASALAVAMKRLLDEPQTRNRLSSGARVCVEAQLSGALEKWTDAVCAKAAGRDCRMQAARL
jgi:GalNAc-alpha-(1->4)-GalNAc-alpha-(1->3)-diNAcBac-PP-undecaprenol alpha-1,4-N-acetyl-D-galactosaminyltransferase